MFRAEVEPLAVEKVGEWDDAVADLHYVGVKRLVRGRIGSHFGLCGSGWVWEAEKD